MDLSSYLNVGFQILKTDTITLSGTSYDCIFHTQNNTSSKETGGMIPDKEFMLNVEASAPEMKDQMVTFRGKSYRCIYERIGDYYKTITLVHKSSPK
jgi:hypothetical protein